MAQYMVYLNLYNMNHLTEAGMSYFAHLRFAWSLAAASLIHGVFPMFFTDYVSKKIQQQNTIKKGN